MNDNVAPYTKYEVNRIIHEVMGVRIGQWHHVEIHIEKKEF